MGIEKSIKWRQLHARNGLNWLPLFNCLRCLTSNKSNSPLLLMSLYKQGCFYTKFAQHYHSNKKLYRFFCWYLFRYFIWIFCTDRGCPLLNIFYHLLMYTKCVHVFTLNLVVLNYLKVFPWENIQNILSFVCATAINKQSTISLLPP